MQSCFTLVYFFSIFVAWSAFTGLAYWLAWSQRFAHWFTSSRSRHAVMGFALIVISGFFVLILDVPVFISDLFTWLGISPDAGFISRSEKLREGLRNLLLVFSSGVGGSLIATALTSNTREKTQHD